MRLFVALIPPASAVRHLAAAVDAVRSDRETSADGRQPAGGLHWVPPQSWHLTLAFLGQVDESRLDDLQARLGRAAGRHERLSLAFVGAGRFGHRLLFAGVEGDIDALHRLHGSVVAAARRARVEVDERRLRPHVTLARARDNTPLAPAAEALGSYVGPRWTARWVELVESRQPGPPGRSPTYVTVHRWPLAAAPAEPAEHEEDPPPVLS